jgi:hypothetical protein
VGIHDRNKKAGTPTNKGIPAPNQADYRGNFGLGMNAAPLTVRRGLLRWAATQSDISGVPSAKTERRRPVRRGMRRPADEPCYRRRACFTFDWWGPESQSACRRASTGSSSRRSALM